MPKKPTQLDLTTLLESWRLALRAQKKSPHTIESYCTGVTLYIRWCELAGHTPRIDRTFTQLFVAGLLEQGLADTTAYNRHNAVRLFTKWLVAEGELTADPLAGLAAPALDEKLTDPLTPDQQRALIQSCTGRDFMARRDEAIVRFMLQTMARAREVVGMLTAETHIADGTALLRGKGGRERLVPFGPATALAIDRYLRIRRTHRLADSPKLWLGGKGRTFDYAGLYYSLNRRAEQAGIPDFHPHQLRHTGADRWLDLGGSEGGLMTVGGWTTDRVMRRYIKRRSAVRALKEAQALNLDEF